MTVREYITNNTVITDYDASRQNLEYLDCRNKTFARVVFDGSSLKNADFTGSTLVDCSFVGCTIKDVTGDGVVIRSCVLGNKSIVLLDDTIAVGCKQANKSTWLRMLSNKSFLHDVDFQVYFDTHSKEVRSIVEGWLCQSS